MTSAAECDRRHNRLWRWLGWGSGLLVTLYLGTLAVVVSSAATSSRAERTAEYVKTKQEAQQETLREIRDDVREIRKWIVENDKRD